MLRGFAFLSLIIVLLGCSASPAEPAPAAPSPAAPAPAAPSAAFSTTDVAWLQLADALHTRALPLLELAPERSASPPLVELAGRLGTAHGTTGRSRLRALLAQARVTGENPHVQHDMPGMPTADDLRELGTLRKADFDRRFVTLLRAYLDQLVLVAKGEQSAGGAAEVRGLAAAMAGAHAAELAELDRVAAR